LLTSIGVSYNFSAYHSYGENDSKVANAQLNSYMGKQVDAILLDSRFTAETEYYREFTLTKNGMIILKSIYKWFKL
jgi:nucleoside recognition membrane protein YjiH